MSTARTGETQRGGGDIPRRRGPVAWLAGRWATRASAPDFSEQTRAEANGGAVGLLVITGLQTVAGGGPLKAIEAATSKVMVGALGGGEQPSPATQPPIVPAVTRGPEQ